MPKKSPPKPHEKPQLERFTETAKQIGAAETDESLPNTIRAIAPLTSKPRGGGPSARVSPASPKVPVRQKQ